MYEYQIIMLDQHTLRNDPKGIVSTLDSLGRMGWVLSSVVHADGMIYYYFMRERAV